MDGILIIDKPAGLTSHDVVARVRRSLKTRRVGHTGTLDPFATGVMVVLIGKATRLARFLDKDEKEYEAVAAIGYETETGDLTGKRREPNEGEMHPVIVQQESVEAALHKFRGPIEQVPPMYSAKKIAGKKLYELARRGEEIDRLAVRVNISKLEITSPLTTKGGIQYLGLRVRCSAGTYIRTLAEDIARSMGTRAHLTELRRTAAGSLSLDSAVTLDKLESMNDPGEALLPMETAVKHLAGYSLTAERAERTRNGLSTRVLDAEFDDGEAVRMIGPDQVLIGVGLYDASENILQPKVVLV